MRAFALLACLLLAACAPEPEPEAASPALWEVTGDGGGKSYLFGTVHALERPVDWRAGKVGEAFERSDVLVVEVASLGDGKAMNDIFARLSRTPGQPPLQRRVRPDLRDELSLLLDKAGFRSDQFAEIETWAAALMLARSANDQYDPKYGIDRALLAAAPGESLQVRELEGTRGQLALFDALPEKEQRDLLEAILRDAASLESQSPDLVSAWRDGDIATIAGETQKGMLADPELRKALFTDRNTAWVRRIAREIEAGENLFVAVGAAHLAGPEGLPAILEERGLEVRRIQ